MTQVDIKHTNEQLLINLKTAYEQAFELDNPHPETLDFLNNLIHAARADRPPLETGWVEFKDMSGTRIVWHENGVLYPQKEKTQRIRSIKDLKPYESIRAVIVTPTDESTQTDGPVPPDPERPWMGLSISHRTHRELADIIRRGVRGRNRGGARQSLAPFEDIAPKYQENYLSVALAVLHRLNIRVTDATHDVDNRA